MVFLRQWIVFLAPGNRSFCAASATLLTGFADDKLNNEKNNGWQDWLAPVVGAMRRFMTYAIDGQHPTTENVPMAGGVDPCGGCRQQAAIRSSRLMNISRNFHLI